MILTIQLFGQSIFEESYNTKIYKKLELRECERGFYVRQVPVQVQVHDRYGHFEGVFACMGPADGPVRALVLGGRSESTRGGYSSG